MGVNWLDRTLPEWVELWQQDRPTDACRTCGHPRTWHEHYRRGTDCGASHCGCWTFQAPPWWRRVFA